MPGADTVGATCVGVARSSNGGIYAVMVHPQTSTILLPNRDLIGFIGYIDATFLIKNCDLILR